MSSHESLLQGQRVGESVPAKLAPPPASTLSPPASSTSQEATEGPTSPLRPPRAVSPEPPAGISSRELLIENAAIAKRLHAKGIITDEALQRAGFTLIEHIAEETDEMLAGEDL